MAARRKQFDPSKVLQSLQQEGGTRPFEKWPQVRQACLDLYKHLEQIGFAGKLPAAGLWREIKDTFGYKQSQDNFRRHLRNLDSAKYDRYFGQDKKPGDA